MHLQCVYLSDCLSGWWTVERRDYFPTFFEELWSQLVCLLSVPRHMPRSLQEMLSRICNNPSEERERVEGGGLRQVRGVKEQQGVSTFEVG